MLPVILNKKAGTFLREQKNGSSGDAMDHVRAIRDDVDIRIVPTKEFGSAVESAAREKPDRIIIGGGDGSVSWAATKLAGTDVSLGVIPFGTFNLFARDLNIPLDLEEACEALATGETKKIDVGEVNGHPFVCNFTWGFLPKIFPEDDIYRDLPWWQKLGLMIYRFIPGFINFRPRAITRRTSAGNAETYHSRFIIVSNNLYKEEFGLLPETENLTDRCLHSFISKHRTPWSMMNGLKRYFTGTWSEDPDLAVDVSRSFEIDIANHPRVTVLLDGEPFEMECPLKFKIRPNALSVIAPTTKTGQKV